MNPCNMNVNYINYLSTLNSCTHPSYMGLQLLCLLMSPSWDSQGKCLCGVLLCKCFCSFRLLEYFCRPGAKHVFPVNFFFFLNSSRSSSSCSSSSKHFFQHYYHNHIYIYTEVNEQENSWPGVADRQCREGWGLKGKEQKRLFPQWPIYLQIHSTLIMTPF